MESWIYYVTVITIFYGAILVQECHGRTHFKYMTNYCSETVEVTASLVVVLAPAERLQDQRSLDYFHCSVDLMAAKGRRLHVHFLHLSISSDQRHTDRLKLYDLVPGRARVPITPAQGIYGMLDRSLLTSDKSGSNVGEFTSSGRLMQVEYLGKPTEIHSGFRMLVTTVADKDAKGKCPEPASMFDCPNQQWCIPSILLCDKYLNCGEDDRADEDGCYLDNLVSSVSYSLSEDILLIIILPLTIFVLAFVLVIFTARWHVNKKYPPQVPAVKYINDGDGEIDLEGNATVRVGEAPPSYTEALAHSQQSKRFVAKPPSYNMLEELEREGVIVDSEDEEWSHQHHHQHQHHHRHSHQQAVDDNDDCRPYRHPNQHYSPLSTGHRVQERRNRDILTTSNSSIENIDDHRSYGNRGSNDRPTSRHHHHHSQHRQRNSPRPIPLHDLDFSFSEDEETKRKARKKGGKSKSKCKRRADDLCNPDTIVSECDNNTVTVPNPLAQRQHEQQSSATSLPNSTSSSLVTTSLPSPSSANSVPFSSSSLSTDNTANPDPKSLSTISSFSQIARRNQNNNSPNNAKSAAVLPLTYSTQVSVHNSNGNVDGSTNKDNHHLYQKETVLHSSDMSMSSGPEADKNNISETESVVLSMVDENNGRTESCASSNNSRNGDIPAKDFKKKGNKKGVDVNCNVKQNGKVVRKREAKKKNSGGEKVKFGLSPFDIKTNGADCDSVGDDNDSVGKELCEDADVSSDSDAGVEVDLRKQAVVSSQSRKKMMTKV